MELQSLERRDVLRSVGGLTLATLVAGCGGPDQDEETDPEADGDPGTGEHPGEADDDDAQDDTVYGDDEETDTNEADDADENGETDTDDDGAETDEDEPDWEAVDTIELDANENGWNGREPDGIEGETNPTLELIEGREYDFTWINNDGERHQLELVDDEGTVEGTDVIEEELESETLSFEATSDLTEYRCAHHLDSMSGTLEVLEE